MSNSELDAFLADQRRQTAHHEAGHAVTAVARGGTFHGLTVEGTATRHGGVHVVHPRAAREFVTFAGPWAEARYDWADRPLDGIDEHGSTLHDYIRASLCANASDLQVYEPSINLPFEIFVADGQGDDAPEVPLARDESWYAELESYWPTMQLAADMVLRGLEIVPEWVRSQLDKIAN